MKGFESKDTDGRLKNKISPGNTLRAAIAAAGVLLHPYSSEARPVRLAEAQAAQTTEKLPHGLVQGISPEERFEAQLPPLTPEQEKEFENFLASRYPELHTTKDNLIEVMKKLRAYDVCPTETIEKTDPVTNLMKEYQDLAGQYQRFMFGLWPDKDDLENNFKSYRMDKDKSDFFSQWGSSVHSRLQQLLRNKDISKALQLLHQHTGACAATS